MNLLYGLDICTGAWGGAFLLANWIYPRRLPPNVPLK